VPFSHPTTTAPAVPNCSDLGRSPISSFARRPHLLSICSGSLPDLPRIAQCEVLHGGFVGIYHHGLLRKAVAGLPDVQDSPDQGSLPFPLNEGVLTLTATNLVTRANPADRAYSATRQSPPAISVSSLGGSAQATRTTLTWYFAMRHRRPSAERGGQTRRPSRKRSSLKSP
jgi:hypothetical protein